MAVRGCSFGLLCVGRSGLRSCLGHLQTPFHPFIRLTASQVKFFHCVSARECVHRTFHVKPDPSSLLPAQCTARSELPRYALRLQQGIWYSNDAPSASTGQPKSPNEEPKSSSEQAKSSTEQPKSYTQRIKVILKEYGTVAVVFHTVVSLFSLGTCYFLVNR